MTNNKKKCKHVWGYIGERTLDLDRRWFLFYCVYCLKLKEK